MGAPGSFAILISFFHRSKDNSVVNSIFVIPINRFPNRINPNLGLVFFSGIKVIVFVTAPPQPLSMARLICVPFLVGGADDNKKGFSNSTPANSMFKLTM